MTKYLVLYRAPASSRQSMASMTPEQAKAGMDMWMAWAKKTGPALVELGSPLGASASIGGKPVDDLGGYSILQGESLDHAKKLLDNHPHSHTPGATYDIVELVKIPGM
jgi:hypothetical protein